MASQFDGAAVVGDGVLGAAVDGAAVDGAAVVGAAVVGAAVVGGEAPQAVGAAAIHQLFPPTWLYLAK